MHKRKSQNRSLSAPGLECEGVIRESEGYRANVLMSSTVGGGLIGVDEDSGMELQQSGAVAADVATAAQVEVESHGGGFLRQQMQHHQG